MNIGGFQQLSLIDYPNKLASVIFTQGCNFNCPYCHNKQLISNSKDNLISEYEIDTILKKQKGLINCIVISGGEPTIQKDLFIFLRKLKQEFNLSIKLDTNGSRPDILLPIIEQKLVNFISLDFKGNKETYFFITNKNEAQNNKFNKFKKTLNLLNKLNIDFELRTTCDKKLIKEKTIIDMAKMLKDINIDWILQQVNGYGEKSNLLKLKEIASKYYNNVIIRG